MNQRKARIWFWIIILYTLSTFILSSVANTPRFLTRKLHYDWWLHGIEYGILAWLLMKFLSYRFFIGRSLPAVGVTLVFCGLVGGLNEALQIFVPNRFPSIADEIANLAGAATAILIYFAFHPINGRKASGDND